MRGRFLAAILMCGFATPGVAGDKGVGVPPPPRSTEVKAVEAWINRYIDVGDDEWAYVSSTDDAAYLLSPSTMDPTRNGTIKFWYRTEFFKADTSEAGIVRSANVLEEIDCSDQRYRLLAVDTYRQNSMGGEAVESLNDPEAEWTFARPNTVAHMLGDAVCEYADKAVEAARKAAAAEKNGEPAVRSHF